MRLVYLSTDPGIPFGGVKGASIHLAAVVEAIAAEGADVLVLVSSSDARSSPPAGVSVEVLPGPPKGADAAEHVAFQNELVSWLETRLRCFGADVLYERLALHSSAGAEVAKRLRVPHLVELNAPLPEEAARYRKLKEPELAERLEGAALSGATLVLAVSPPLAAYAKARGASRVEILQNAAAIQKFARARPDSADPVAVFAGSLRPWHGIETIATAWRMLGPAAPRLLVIGDGAPGGLLRGLPATVAGQVAPARVPALLARAAIGLAPYSADAPDYFSPLKLFDYLAAGLATVVADLPAVTDVVDENSAVVIPRGNAGALADAVTALCGNPSERRRLGEKGRALVEARHTWRHRARRILEAAAECAPIKAVA
jgi:glycosyltransferase involved in cell wall biosynthesis